MPQYGPHCSEHAIMTSSFRTHPTDSARMPPGIPYIVGNEAAERFSFYGMKAILIVFMTEYSGSTMNGIRMCVIAMIVPVML